MMQYLRRMIIPGQCSQAHDQPRCVIAKMDDPMRMIIQSARSRAHGPRCMIMRDFMARCEMPRVATRVARLHSASRESIAGLNAQIASRVRRAIFTTRRLDIRRARGDA